MLVSMTVRNIALIEQLQIEFQKGMQVLSGETGAGKSIIVDSINLVLGERADRGLIRSGCDRASVEALVDISDCPQAAAVLAEQQLEQAANPSLFVVGQVGRSYFTEHGIPIDVEFLYTAQNPTMARARDMSELMLDLFTKGQLDEVYVLFTKMVTSFQMEPTIHKLLPLDPDAFPKYQKGQDTYNRDVTYVPSVKAVMDRLVPGYAKGELFGALVESYCSEQNARMTAMKSSSDSAREMLRNLNLSFNRARQAAITQEITEVVGGAQAAL